MATSTAAVLPRRAGISRAAIVGWSIVAGYVVLGVASLALERAHVGRPGFLELWLSVAVLAYAVIGALVLSSQPRHVIGWMFCIAALSFGLAFFAGEYAVQDDEHSNKGQHIWFQWLKFIVQIRMCNS